MQVNTIFKTVNSRTLVEENGVRVSGMGQKTVDFLRGQLPKFSKIVLLGWEINGKFMAYDK